MSDKAISIIRWVLLASAGLNVLQATVLFRILQRRIVRPWFEASARAGTPVPAVVRDERMQRAWPALMAAFCLAAWWYLGTAAGAALVRRAMQQG